MSQEPGFLARSRGFSLVEMAVGMLIIALLLGSILVPLSTQVEQRKTSETQKVLEEMREAVLGYAIANGHLPCPDKTVTTGAGTRWDGAEDASATTCAVPEGYFPWATLGTPSADSWGNRFRYRVHLTFAQRGPPVLGFTTASTIDVCADSACTSRLTNASDGPPAVIISHGRNGLGGYNATTNSQNPLPPAGTDERENTDEDLVFVSRIESATGSGLGEFDDIVLWLPRGVLLNRLVSAGKLP
jgi:prepilin-type N-terminal cleavage/methylation domain-containing protein